MAWYQQNPVAGKFPPLQLPMVYRHTVTRDEVKAGHVIVPAIAGKIFHPIFAAMSATVSVATSTHIRLVETTTGGIILGHVAADMTDGLWVSETGGTPVITKLNTDLVRGEGIKIIDVLANSLTGTTSIDVMIVGYHCLY